MTKKLEQITKLIGMMTGLEGVLAGGCVRDTLMCQKPKDYDFLVENYAHVDMEVLLSTIEEYGGVVHKALGVLPFAKNLLRMMVIISLPDSQEECLSRFWTTV